MTDEQRDRTRGDAGRALCASTQELVIKYSESDGRRVWAGQTRAATKVWVAWPAVVRNLDDNDVSPCSFFATAERFLLIGRGSAAQKWHKYFLSEMESHQGTPLLLSVRWVHISASLWASTSLCTAVLHERSR